MDNAHRPRHALGVLVIEDPAALHHWTTAWEDLAAHAAEPNAFYEPWMLLPAIQFLSRSSQLLFVLVTADARVSGEPGVLCGFFPLERSSRYLRLLPLRHLTLWKHSHCYLCTPLLRKGSEREALTALFEWLATDPRGSSLFEVPLVADEGPVFEALVTLLGHTDRPFFVSKRETRALLRRRADGEAYIAEALPGKRRKEFRRLEHRLAETGRLQYVEPGPAAIGAWSEAFLALEAGGWKGRAGTALASTEEGRRFFAAIARAGPDRVMLLGLHLNGRPVAVKCNLLAGQGSFAFKIAFDESHARFSPGVLLELEHIRRFHHRSTPDWTDSCATPDHFMANRLWLDRRTVRTLLVSTRRGAGDLLVASLRPMWGAFRLIRGSGPATAPATHSIARPSAVTRPGDVSTSGQGASLLDIAPGTVHSSFGRTPFRVRHRLGESELFQLPRLLDLARRLPESSVEYNAGDVPLTLDPSRTPRTGLSVDETIQRIESCRSWLVLKNVEQDPEYRTLLERCLAEVRHLSHAVSPGMSGRAGFIFISSPGSVTPYHLDPEENFLLQIRGRKTMHVFDASDRSILSNEEIERFVTGADRNLVFRDEYQPKAQIFPLGPGEGVHVPVTCPHWVRNGEEVSISFSITFQTRASARSTHAHRMNARLRHWGLAPIPVGSSPWRDAVKQFAYRTTQIAARVWPRPPAWPRASQR